VFTNDVMALHQAALPPLADISGVKIIPARASFRHTRQLVEESAARWKTPQLTDAKMLHLDDPHWDALLALKDGQLIAFIGALAVREIRRLEDVYGGRSARGQDRLS